MRINLYSQELLTDNPPEKLGEPPYTGAKPVVVVHGLSQPGIVGEDGQTFTYSAVRQYLYSSDRLHDDPEDDDRSAITWWLPKNPERRENLAQQFEALARLVREAPPETGLD